MGDFLKNTCDEPVDSAPHLWVPKPHRCCYRVDASCRLSILAIHQLNEPWPLGNADHWAS